MSREDERLQRAREGDDRALSSLFRSAELPLQELARTLVGDRLRAKVRTSDLVQSTFAEAVGSWSSFRGATEAEFFQWMRRILENNVRDKHRHFTTLRRNSDREVEADASELQRCVDQRKLPSEQASLRDELDGLTEAISTLPLDQRRVLLLAAARGLSHREIAARMNRSEGACRVLLSRARANLVARLAQSENDPTS